MSDLFIYAIPGIFESPDDPNSWNNRAQAWFVENGYCKEGNAAGYSYGADVPGSLRNDDDIAATVAKDLHSAMDLGREIIIIGHSNGARIIFHALRNDPTLKVKRIVLIAAADHADCDDNGLNNAAADGQIEQLQLYVSPDDEALGIGNLLGYGTLGKTGPANPSPTLVSITVLTGRHCKHSDWVTVYFAETMGAAAA